MFFFVNLRINGEIDFNIISNGNAQLSVDENNDNRPFVHFLL